MKYHTVIFALLVGASYQINLRETGSPQAVVELDEEELDR